MVKIQIKGGVWKNSEDEVLKAAVMKYGLNNWSRVSSLLVKKTPSQCKARWVEWIDPSVKKTEWSKEEDEKLLQMAKTFPTQWRTIAPQVGRTAYQCLDRYEKLMDMAQGKTFEDADANDPRRLQPGELDPIPETKPAKADAKDMDEDEKEMLIEARARIANFRGKKAKRKAREKQMDEARRLAQLQKVRELKAAGISTGGGKQKRKRRHGVDYGTEIPFEAAIPAGFHATGAEENPVSSIGTSKISLQNIEQARRDKEEELKRKQDKRNLDRLKKDDLAKQLEVINKMNDPASTRKATNLSLPAPQLQAWELAQMAKVGEENTRIASEAGGLLQSYDTPMVGGTTAGGMTAGGLTMGGGMFAAGKTPLPERDLIMEEATNAVRQKHLETPLIGGENPELFEGMSAKRRKLDGGGIERIEGEKERLLGDRTAGGMTAGGMTAGGMTAGGMTAGMTAAGMTPFRDGLSLNQWGQGGGKSNKDLAREMLRNMSAPTSEVQIEMPTLPEFEEEEDDFELDAAEVERQQEEETRRQQELEAKLRSRALQRNLPVPKNASGTDFLAFSRIAEQAELAHLNSASSTNSKGAGKGAKGGKGGPGSKGGSSGDGSSSAGANLRGPFDEKSGDLDMGKLRRKIEPMTEIMSVVEDRLFSTVKALINKDAGKGAAQSGSSSTSSSSSSSRVVSPELLEPLDYDELLMVRNRVDTEVQLYIQDQSDNLRATTKMWEGKFDELEEGEQKKIKTTVALTEEQEATKNKISRNLAEKAGNLNPALRSEMLGKVNQFHETKFKRIWEKISEMEEEEKANEANAPHSPKNVGSSSPKNAPGSPKNPPPNGSSPKNTPAHKQAQLKKALHSVGLQYCKELLSVFHSARLKYPGENLVDFFDREFAFEYGKSQFLAREDAKYGNAYFIDPPDSDKTGRLKDSPNTSNSATNSNSPNNNTPSRASASPEHARFFEQSLPSAGIQKIVDSAAIRFEFLKDTLKEEASKAAKKEKNLSKTWAVHFKEIKQSHDRVAMLTDEKSLLKHEVEGYENCLNQERANIEERKTQSRELLAREKGRNQALQREYTELEKVKRELEARLA